MKTYNTLPGNAVMTDVNHILVFKTNIATEPDKQRIQNSLIAKNEIQQCNIDLHDIDCVLRIVTDALTATDIISIINHNGFQCAELE